MKSNYLIDLQVVPGRGGITLGVDPIAQPMAQVRYPIRELLIFDVGDLRSQSTMIIVKLMLKWGGQFS